MRLLVLFTCIFFSLSLFAKEERFYLKMKIERELEQDISEKLNTLIAKKLYTLKAAVSFKEEIKNKGFRIEKYESTPLTKFDILDESYVKSIGQSEDKETNLELGAIVVNVYLASVVSDANTEIIKKLITTSFASFGKLKITYNFNKFEKIAQTPPTILDRLEKHAAIIGIFIFALLFLALGIGAIYKFYKMGKLTLSAMDQIMVKIEQSAYDSINNTENQKKIEEKENEVVGSAADLMNIKFAKFEGAKRFVQLYQKYPQRASLEIKKWFFASSKIPLYATSLILRYMDIDTLNDFLSHFDVSQKKRLKSTLSLRVSSDLYYQADGFIVESLTRLALEPEMVEDDLYTLIISQPKEKLISIIKEDSRVGSYLLAVLPKTLADEILAEVDVDTFNKIMSNSLDFSQKDLKKQIQGIKDVFNIKSIVRDKEINPILEDAKKLLFKSTEDKENTIFDVLASTTSQNDFMKIAIDHFPYDLFDKIPDELIKQSLIAMDNKSRAEYLVVMDETERANYLDLLGDSTSKLRDMVELDVNKIIDKYELLENAKNFELVNRREFIKVVRGVMASSINQSQTKKLLAEWVQSKYHLNNDEDINIEAAS